MLYIYIFLSFRLLLPTVLLVTYSTLVLQPTPPAILLTVNVSNLYFIPVTMPVALFIALCNLIKTQSRKYLFMSHSIQKEPETPVKKEKVLL